MNEYGHPFSICRGGLLTCSGSCACTGSRTLGSRLCLNPCGYGDSRCCSIELEIAPGKIIIRSFIFKKDHFAEGLTTQLESNGCFYQRYAPGNLTFSIDLPFSKSAANADPALTYRRKHRITIGVFEKRLHCFCFFININRILILVRLYRTCQDQCQDKNYRHHMKTSFFHEKYTSYTN